MYECMYTHIFMNSGSYWIEGQPNSRCVLFWLESIFCSINLTYDSSCLRK